MEEGRVGVVLVCLIVVMGCAVLIYPAIYGGIRASPLSPLFCSPPSMQSLNLFQSLPLRFSRDLIDFIAFLLKNVPSSRPMHTLLDTALHSRPSTLPCRHILPCHAVDVPLSLSPLSRTVCHLFTRERRSPRHARIEKLSGRQCRRWKGY